MLANQAPLFDPPPLARPEGVRPWHPRVVGHGDWPPDYVGVYAWRMAQLHKLKADKGLLKAARDY